MTLPQCPKDEPDTRAERVPGDRSRAVQGSAQVWPQMAPDSNARTMGAQPAAWTVYIRGGGSNTTLRREVPGMLPDASSSAAPPDRHVLVPGVSAASGRCCCRPALRSVTRS